VQADGSISTYGKYSDAINVLNTDGDVTVNIGASGNLTTNGGSSSKGVYIRVARDVMVATAGTITAGGDGLGIDNAEDVTVTNSGAITSGTVPTTSLCRLTVPSPPLAIIPTAFACAIRRAM
jgi:hypothetical protein